LLTGNVVSGESWNFGPRENDVHTVADVAARCVSVWGSGSVVVDASQQTVHEATLLQLNCAKAANRLHWTPRWNYETTVDRTVEWYRRRNMGTAVQSLVQNDIDEYISTS